jgi:hypothetical protein
MATALRQHRYRGRTLKSRRLDRKQATVNRWHLQSAVGGVARQRRPARERVAYRLRERALATDLAQHLLQEGFEPGQERNGVLPAYGQALGRRVAMIRASTANNSAMRSSASLASGEAVASWTS